MLKQAKKISGEKKHSRKVVRRKLISVMGLITSHRQRETMNQRNMVI